jgi:ATP-binding cassette subfamily B protein
MATIDHRAVLQKNALLSLVPEVALGNIEGTIESYVLGDVVLRAGDAPDSFFVIQSGSARVVTETVTLAKLGPGHSFGEEGLMTGRPSEVTVRASGALIVIRIRGDEFRRLVEAQRPLREAVDARMARAADYRFLKTLTLFSDVAPANVEKLLDTADHVELDDGQALFHEGALSDHAYVLRSGVCNVVKESASNRLLNVVRPGALIGEMVPGQRESAAVIATENATLLRLCRDVFEQVLAASPRARLIVDKHVENAMLREAAILTTEHQPRSVAPEVLLRMKPVRMGKGWFRHTIPFVETDDPILAGLACLQMTARIFRIDNDAATYVTQQLAAGNPDTLISLSRKAEGWGLLTRLMNLSAESLPMLQYPAAFQRESGLALLVSCRDDQITIADPLGGVEVKSIAEFVDEWSGELLQISYAANFASATSMAGLAKTIVPLIRPYTPLLLTVLALSFLVQALSLAAPLFSMRIVDDVLIHGDRSLLGLMLLGVLLVTVFQLIGSTVRELLLTQVIRRISIVLRVSFFRHLLSLPLQTLGRWKVGEHLQRINENDRVLELVSDNGLRVIVDTLTVVIYLGVLLTMNARLTAVALAFVMAMALIMIISSPFLRANERRLFTATSASESHIIETVTSIDTVKMLAVEPMVFRQGLDLLTETKKEEIRSGRLGLQISLLSSLTMSASTIVVLGYGALLTLRGELTTGQLVAFLAIVGLVLGPLSALIGVWDKLQQIRISAERLGDVLRKEPERQDPTAAMPRISGHIRFDKVSFRYEGTERDVLSEIDFEAKPGEKIAFVGRSGSGKTTIANLLLRLLEPTSGRITVDGRDLATTELSTYRRQIGVVEQNPYLFGGTIRENIGRTDSTAGIERIAGAATVAGASEFIDELPLRYETQIGERGVTLSGGQRQRIVIARALLNDPRILLLDEATSALDSESERIIQDNLDNVMSGRTSFVIAHRLSTVRNADRILVIDEGRIVESGSHDLLMAANGIYASMNTRPAGES